MPRKINLKLFCIDGSLVSDASKGLPFEQRVLDKNQGLLEHFVRDINMQLFDEVILAMTDPYDIPSHNKFSSNIGPAVHALPLLQDFLGNLSEVKSDVMIDTLMLPDALSTSKDSAYRTLLADTVAKRSSEVQAGQAAQLSNPSLALQVYLHAHRLATVKPEDEITIDIIDKDEETSEQLERFFTKHPALLPKNVRLNISSYYYNNEIGRNTILMMKNRVHDEGEEIQGKGEIDAKADWSVRYLIAAEAHKISTGGELSKYHENNQYLQDNPSLQTSFGTDQFDEDSFLAFRSKDIVWLEATLPSPTYTSARRLAAEKLLPDTFFENSTSLDQPEERPQERRKQTSSAGALSQVPRVSANGYASTSHASLFSGIDVYAGDQHMKSSERGTFALYKRDLMTTKEYLNAIPKSLDMPNYDGPDFITALKEIANQSKWETKGGFRFISPTIPDGIKAVREFRGRDINGLCSILSKKLLSYTATRSMMTQDFYELAVAVSDGRVNGTARLQAVHAFCEKHSLSDPSIIQGQRRQQSAYRL